MDAKSNLQWSKATLLALGMTALGYAIEVASGDLGRRPYPSIAFLTLSILLTACATFLPAAPVRWGRRHFEVVVGLCLLANLGPLVSRVPCQDLTTVGHLPYFQIGVVITSFFSGIVLTTEGKTRLAALAVLLVAIGYLGNWAIVNCRNPPIDVYVFQNDSSAALGDGRNPYELTFPVPFTSNIKYYGEGLVQNRRLQFGYPYFPETLLAIMPASVLEFDVRYTQLAAVLLTAMLFVIVSPGPIGFSAALLFITTPRLYLVLEKSWIEPLVVVLLAATVACAAKRPKWLPVALGLFLASKQYVPAAGVLFFAGSRSIRETVAILVKASVVASVMTLPLALWNCHAFWHSVIELQFHQPFRPDALSYLSWMGESFWWKQSLVVIPFAALLLATALVLWRRRSTTFAAAVAFCFLLFFAFNKQAFANYYFFVIGAMACAIVELTANSASGRSTVKV